jgi:prohibitin 2
MAEKLNEFAGKFGKGGAPRGLGTGIKLLAAAVAGVYGIQQSLYTGKFFISKVFEVFEFN